MIKRRPAGEMALATVLRLPWVSPVVVIVAVAGAGQLGRVWLFATIGVAMLGGVAVGVGLFAFGRRVGDDPRPEPPDD